MKKLTVKEQNFAELCVTLGNQTEAYRQSHNVKDNDADWIRVRASELASKSNIKVTIDSLKDEAKAEHGIDRAFILKGYLEIISDVDYTFKLGKDNQLSKEDSKAFYRIMQQTKNTDKLRALESISKMLGLNAPEEISHTHTLKTYKTNWS